MGARLLRTPSRSWRSSECILFSNSLVCLRAFVSVNVLVRRFVRINEQQRVIMFLMEQVAGDHGCAPFSISCTTISLDRFATERVRCCIWTARRRAAFGSHSNAAAPPRCSSRCCASQVRVNSSLLSCLHTPPYVLMICSFALRFSTASHTHILTPTRVRAHHTQFLSTHNTHIQVPLSPMRLHSVVLSQTPWGRRSSARRCSAPAAVWRSDCYHSSGLLIIIS